MLVIHWPNREVPALLALAGFKVVVHGGPGPEVANTAIRVNEKVLPWPRWLLTLKKPPSASLIVFAMGNLIPATLANCAAERIPTCSAFSVPR